MHLTVQHTRLFRTVYRSPQQCYILSCIFVSIEYRIAVVTSKLLALSIPYMQAIMTRLTCISRWYIYQFNTVKQRFVSKETSKLVEVPFTYSCSKFLTFLVGRKSNTPQILNGNSFTFGFSKLNNLFTNGMVNNCTRSSFFARQSFQDFFRAFRTFALKRTPYFLSFFSIIVKFFRTKVFTVTKGCDFEQSHIHSDKLFHILNVFFGDINSLEQVKLAFLVNQIGFPLNVGQISRIMANKLNLLATTNAPQGNDVVWLISHNTTVISNTTKWFKLPFNFLIQLISISNFSYLPYKNLRRKPKRSLVSVVRPMVKFKVIENLFLPSYIRNSITNSVGFLHRFEKQVNLFISRQKFYFQCQLHSANILNFLIFEKHLLTKGIGAFLPPTSIGDEWVSALVL